MDEQSNLPFIKLIKVTDEEQNTQGYTKIPSIENIPDHFAAVGNKQAAEMLQAVIEKARSFQKRGIVITHRAYFSGDELSDFLHGKFSYTTANLLQTLEHLETALEQYFDENGAFDPLLESTLFWGESQYELDFFRKKDRLSLHGGMTLTGVHERLMRSIIKRTEKKFDAINGVLKTYLDTVSEAVQLAQAEIGCAHDLKITPAVLAAMSELQTEHFDGSALILSSGTNAEKKLMITGIPQVLNCYHAILEDTTLYSMTCWGEFVSDPEAFLHRCLTETGLLGEKVELQNLLLFQFYLNLKRIQSTCGKVMFRFTFAQKNFSTAELMTRFAEIPSEAKRDINAYVTACQAVLGKMQQSENLVRLAGKSDGQNALEFTAILRRNALETHIDDGGGALYYLETDKAEIAQRKAKYLTNGHVQELNDIMPPAYWKAIENQTKSNTDRIGELRGLICHLNKKYGCEVSIKYFGDSETNEQIAEKRTIPRRSLLLRCFGPIGEAIAVLRNAETALAFYNSDTGNPLAGQEIELHWFDSHDPDNAKYDMRRKKTKISGTETVLVHHQCGHLLDMLEGNQWETIWYEQNFERVLCFKRAIDAQVAQGGELSLLDFREKDKTIIWDMRTIWIDKKLNYRFRHKSQSISIALYLNRNGSYKGSPSEFSLTSGAEERAELWMMFVSSPTELGDLDMDGQRRLVAMAKVLTEQGILSKSWFVEKCPHFENLL